MINQIPKIVLYNLLELRFAFLMTQRHVTRAEINDNIGPHGDEFNNFNTNFTPVTGM